MITGIVLALCFIIPLSIGGYKIRRYERALCEREDQQRAALEAAFNTPEAKAWATRLTKPTLKIVSNR
jgi:hypothetical protein